MITERRFQCARTYIQSYLPFRLTGCNVFAREEFSVKIKDFKHLLHANISISQIKLNVKQSDKYMAENALEQMFLKLKGLEKIRRKFCWSPIYEIRRPADSTQNKLLLSSAAYIFLLSLTLMRFGFQHLRVIETLLYLLYIFQKVKKKKANVSRIIST